MKNAGLPVAVVAKQRLWRRATGGFCLWNADSRRRQEALYEIEIPAAVCRGVTRADLGDVRIVNGQGEVVPHGLRPGGQDG
ncbi:MAG: DUF3999 family protein [Candidatus Binatia bacterium]